MFVRQRNKEAVAAFWDAEACGERYGNDQERVRYELEPQIAGFAAFDEATGLDVLEIGVGMGADFVRWLRGGARASGVDLTERGVELTRSRAQVEGHHAEVRVADAEALPFHDATFDLVYSWGVLHHTPDTARAFREAIRVLRPGGSLKVMIYHRHSWVALVAWVRFCLLRGRPLAPLREAVSQIESPGTQAFTKREAESLLQGLEGVSVRPVLTHWDRKWAPGVSTLVGDRAGWFLLLRGTKPLQ